MVKYKDVDNVGVIEPFRVTLPPGRTTNNILIVDDSYQTCSLLVTGILRSCAENGQLCQIIQAGRFGLIHTVPLDVVSGINSPVTVYTASTAKYALQVLRLKHLEMLTIICDISMPNDTEVGVLGLLNEIAALQLPVNLVFASTESQNRYYIEELIKNRKAYFVEKGTSFWANLPFALAYNSHRFEYRQVHRTDYDKSYALHLKYQSFAQPRLAPMASPVAQLPVLNKPAPVVGPARQGNRWLAGLGYLWNVLSSLWQKDIQRITAD